MTTVLLILLALVFAGAGGAKVAGVKPMADNFERWPVPAGSMPVVGGIELLITASAIGGLFTDPLAYIAGGLAICTMLGAIITHVRAGDKPPEIAPPVVLLALSVLLVATI